MCLRGGVLIKAEKSIFHKTHVISCRDEGKVNLLGNLATISLRCGSFRKAGMLRVTLVRVTACSDGGMLESERGVVQTGA